MSLSIGAYAQTPWVLPGNNSINPSTDYLGTQNNADLVLRSNAISRFRLQSDATYTIGSFATQVKDGSLLLCPKVDNFYGNGAPGPYSLLHLAALDDNSQSQSYRDWMNTGITFTGNADHSYIGQKATELDFTDMVIHWSDNPGEYLKDRLRFIFTSGYDNMASSGAQSREGLEFMRMFPSRYEEPFVGIGDFYAANLADAGITEPEERLDIVNGKVRIRQLPTDDPEELDKVMVVDDNGVVSWRPFTDFAGQTDCDWTVEFQGTSGSTVPHDVYTAVGSPSDDCPDITDAVGIGTSQPVYKLDVKHSDLDAQRDGGLRVAVETDNAGWRSGIASTITPASTGAELAFGAAISADIVNVGLEEEGTADAYGVFARSTTSEDLDLRKSIGVYGDAVASDGTPTSLWGGEFSARGTGAAAVEGIGVYAHVNNSTGTMTTGYGIYAGSAGATTNWAGWFQGDIMVAGTPISTAGGPFTMSDEALKTDPNVIEDAGLLLAQLQPKTYSFTEDEGYARLNLPSGPQAGFYAQELEQVFPTLVKEVTFPAKLDTMGNEVSAALPLKAVNYTGLIPYLVAAFQEQNARMAALESDLASCCSNGERSMHSTTATGTALETDLRIIPNPVADQTGLRYTVGTGGPVRLEITDAAGRTIRVQDEGSRTTGAYVYEWNTTMLAPGTYYCTLYVNDEPLVKKAVKLNAR